MEGNFYVINTLSLKLWLCYLCSEVYLKNIITLKIEPFNNVKHNLQKVQKIDIPVLNIFNKT